MDIGSAVGRQKGLSDEELMSLADFRTSSLYSQREKMALEYAEEISKTPVVVSDELFARLREHFDDDQIVELSASIAYENYRARFYHAMGVESEGLYVCMLPPRSAGAGQHD